MFLAGKCEFILKERLGYDPSWFEYLAADLASAHVQCRDTRRGKVDVSSLGCFLFPNATFRLLKRARSWAVGWETETATAADWEVRTELSPDGVSMLSDEIATGAEMGTDSLKLYNVVMDHCILTNAMLVWRTKGENGKVSVCGIYNG